MNGDATSYYLDSTSHLVQEADGLRVLGSITHDLLQKVSWDKHAFFSANGSSGDEIVNSNHLYLLLIYMVHRYYPSYIIHETWVSSQGKVRSAWCFMM